MRKNNPSQVSSNEEVPHLAASAIAVSPQEAKWLMDNCLLIIVPSALFEDEWRSIKGATFGKRNQICATCWQILKKEHKESIESHVKNECKLVEDSAIPNEDASLEALIASGLTKKFREKMEIPMLFCSGPCFPIKDRMRKEMAQNQALSDSITKAFENFQAKESENLLGKDKEIQETHLQLVSEYVKRQKKALDNYFLKQDEISRYYSQQKAAVKTIYDNRLQDIENHYQNRKRDFERKCANENIQLELDHKNMRVLNKIYFEFKKRMVFEKFIKKREAKFAKIQKDSQPELAEFLPSIRSARNLDDNFASKKDEEEEKVENIDPLRSAEEPEALSPKFESLREEISGERGDRMETEANTFSKEGRQNKWKSD